MSAPKAFDEMMGQFLGELARTFPDEPAKTPIDSRTFMAQVAPWASKMMAKDDSFFCEQNEFVNQLGLQKIWTREDCTPASKEAIWQYISSLYMMGTMFSMIPPQMLSVIEAAAESAAKNIAAGGEMDLASMLNQISGGAQRPKPKIRAKKSSR